MYQTVYTSLILRVSLIIQYFDICIIYNVNTTYIESTEQIEYLIKIVHGCKIQISHAFIASERRIYIKCTSQV